MMASFEEMLTALKKNIGAKNTRSPLNDPFYAESLIIQSKAIVGRMYSSNEYVRFKYESELNQLVKEYRVWLAEIKREEREVSAKLDSMRKEQRGIATERRDLQAIQLVAKTNREFINHYKRRSVLKRNDRSALQIPPRTAGGVAYGQEKRGSQKVPPKSASFDFGINGNKLKKVLRLPKIDTKVDGVARVTKGRRTSLPAISSQHENFKTARDTQRTKHETYDKEKDSGASKRPEHIEAVRSIVKTQRENENTESQFSNPIKHSGHKETATLEKSTQFQLTSRLNASENTSRRKPKPIQVLVSLPEEEEGQSIPASTAFKKPRILSAPKSRSNDQEVIVMADRPSSACEMATT